MFAYGLTWQKVAGPAVALVLITAPSVGWALQPLDVFIHSALKHNPDNLEARANREAQEGQTEVVLGRILPGLSARGTYTRNEYDVHIAFPLAPPPAPPLNLTIQPQNQWDGYFTVSVPLIDVASYLRFAAARTNVAGSERQEDATALRVEAQVTQMYYQLVANAVLVSAAEHALEVAQTNLELTRDRLHAGRAARLDEARAEAEVERQQGELTAARLQVTLAARALETLSGVSAEVASAAVPLDDDLQPEAAVDTFVRHDEALPALHAAMLARQALEQQALAQKLTLIPSLNGAFTERLTNSTGFSGGHSHFWLGSINLVWNFDLTTLGNIAVADAAWAAGSARELRARLQAHDDIYNVWNRVQSGIVRSRSARAQARATTEAANWAKDRYAAGVATQLDLLVAQRDAFVAEATRIQADADLVNARAQLRYAAGVHFDHFADRSADKEMKP